MQQNNIMLMPVMPNVNTMQQMQMQAQMQPAPLNQDMRSNLPPMPMPNAMPVVPPSGLVPLGANGATPPTFGSFQAVPMQMGAAPPAADSSGRALQLLPSG